MPRYKFDLNRLCDVCGKWRNGKEDHSKCARVRQQRAGAQPACKPKPMSEEQLRYFSKL